MFKGGSEQHDQSGHAALISSGSRGHWGQEEAQTLDTLVRKAADS